MTEKTVEIKNKTGLHARPAALFVQAASKFSSQIWVEKENKKVNAKSIMGIMSLGVAQGNTVKLIADGSDEQEAIKALVDLIDSKFGEE
ncbi:MULTISPECIES: HPr family phosphocarrier protein [Thermoanaerobacterium]|jgi:phosphocarrier protein HPr|uniref:Phosphocarrier protein HPr n=5 Tax=Thermoanaerobacterium TaxID=28895 RepID=D9TLJ5_THETC|nr:MULTISPECIES: HPr family phosphocarrier protein [Thermoanaerobacterium]MDI3477315.1 phosphocarrier protein HPr [Thermoanaerobacterium sp.]TCW40203.1 phosphocarrier protein [Thermohydrogenium kirishiense]ADL68320.1 Phosphotransferase system, phosphocarrier protein HPr [Thermoanaerobacterium thermosaccharolyticum DSM 571]AEF16681.1 Phosphotransferase system, phosphocarrier protein HPr [Thermoanaerobacterium xylanolyticum LX-11]AGB18431.1 phosphotransferase system HPr (HPr) family protein [The